MERRLSTTTIAQWIRTLTENPEPPSSPYDAFFRETFLDALLDLRDLIYVKALLSYRENRFLNNRDRLVRELVDLPREMPREAVVTQTDETITYNATSTRSFELSLRDARHRIVNLVDWLYEVPDSEVGERAIEPLKKGKP